MNQNINYDFSVFYYLYITIISVLNIWVIVLLYLNKNEKTTNKFYVFISLCISGLIAPICYLIQYFKSKKLNKEINTFELLSVIGLFTTSLYILRCLGYSVKYYIDFNNPLIPTSLYFQTIGELLLKVFILIVLLFLQFKKYKKRNYKVSIFIFLICFLISFSLQTFYSYMLF